MFRAADKIDIDKKIALLEEYRCRIGYRYIQSLVKIEHRWRRKRENCAVNWCLAIVMYACVRAYTSRVYARVHRVLRVFRRIRYLYARVTCADQRRPRRSGILVLVPVLGEVTCLDTRIPAAFAGKPGTLAKVDSQPRTIADQSGKVNWGIWDPPGNGARFSGY